LVTLVLTAQVGPVRAYACTSDADCDYEGCNNNSCSGYERYNACNNGVWDGVCYSYYGTCFWDRNAQQRGASCPDPAPCAPGTYSIDGKNAGGDKACTECKPGESFDRRWCVDLCRKLPCRKLQYILRCGQGQIYMQIYMCALHLAHMDVSVINLIYMHVGHLCICYTQIHTCECTCIHVSVSCMHACINTCMQT
jgi:hypothetical protein